MNHHDLKIHPPHFKNVEVKTKTFEIRSNDRPFQKGDTLTLHEYDPETKTRYIDEYHGPGYNETVVIGYTGKKLSFKIGDVYPIDAERVVFSLLPEDS